MCPSSPFYYLTVLAALALMIVHCSEFPASPIHDLPIWWRDLVKWLEEMWKPPRFTRFTELPPELRLMIWEAAVHNRPVDQNSVCNLWYFKRDSSYESKDSIKIDAPYQPYQPFGLLWACYESRTVVLSRMSLLMYETENDYGPPRRKLKFVDKTVRSIMPSSRTTKWPRGIPKSFQSYVEFNPDRFWLPNILDQLISDPRHNIKTFLFGLVWIPLPYSSGDDLEKYPCVDSTTAAVPLDDPRLLGYLRRAFRRHARNMNEDISDECHRKSAMRYLAWQKLVHHDLRLIEKVAQLRRRGYNVKPCVIFGMALRQPEEVLHECIAQLDRFMYRSEDVQEVEEWDATTPYPPPTNWTHHKLCQARYWRSCQLLSYHIHSSNHEYLEHMQTDFGNTIGE